MQIWDQMLQGYKLQIWTPWCDSQSETKCQSMDQSCLLLKCLIWKRVPFFRPTPSRPVSVPGQRKGMLKTNQQYKTRRGIKRNCVVDNKLRLVGCNANGISSKLQSLDHIILSLNPTIWSSSAKTVRESQKRPNTIIMNFWRGMSNIRERPNSSCESMTISGTKSWNRANKRGRLLRRKLTFWLSRFFSRSIWIVTN